jgi:hypothetical protein
VLAAVGITWLCSTGTALVTAMLMLGALVFLEPLFDSFGSGGDDLRWFAYGGGAAVILVCAAADVVAWLLYRGRRWARWPLIALSLLATAGGIVLSYYVVPVVVSLTALTVIVLLLLPAKAPRRP